MLGLFQILIESWAVETHGEEAWLAIKSKMGLKKETGGWDWVTSCPYPDHQTFKLFAVVAEVTGQSVDEIQESIGMHQVAFLSSIGHEQLLQNMASTLADFIWLLNDLHHSLKISYPSLVAPYFRVDKVESTSLLVHYYSSRKGLERMVAGMLKSIAVTIFGMEDVSVTVLNPRNSESQQADHEVFQMTYPYQPNLVDWAPPGSPHAVKPALNEEPIISQQPALVLPDDFLDTAFPYHFAVSPDLVIIKAGASLKFLLPDLEVGVSTLTESFNVIQPRISAIFPKERSYRTLCEAEHACFLISVLSSAPQASRRQTEDSGHAPHGQSGSQRRQPQSDQLLKQMRPPSSEVAHAAFALRSCSSTLSFARGSSQRKGLTVQGQIKLMESTSTSTSTGSMRGKCVVFLGSPLITNGFEELTKYGMFVSDLPVFDKSISMAMLAENARSQGTLREGYEAMTAMLEEEKARSEALLHRCLPRGVVDRLRQGKEFEATAFKELSIMFTDIVGFTGISSSISPIEICSMLNELYDRFDTLLRRHFPAAWKVDIIGDSFMVVCNLTGDVTDHVDQCIDLGLMMIEEAKKTDSRVKPGVFSPLHVRVGLHTGPAVAGVIGGRPRKTEDSLPSAGGSEEQSLMRFTVLGDAVNTAARMESHGVPDKVHLSEASFSLLSSPRSYDIQGRGLINVKGKGQMKTYLVSKYRLPSDQLGDVPGISSTSRRLATSQSMGVDFFSLIKRPTSDEDDKETQEAAAFTSRRQLSQSLKFKSQRLMMTSEGGNILPPQNSHKLRSSVSFLLLASSGAHQRENNNVISSNNSNSNALRSLLLIGDGSNTGGGGGVGEVLMRSARPTLT